MVSKTYYIEVTLRDGSAVAGDKVIVMLICSCFAAKIFNIFVVKYYES